MKKITWHKYHRWFGLTLSVFMLVFCISGIGLNHRSMLRSHDVGRWWMPPSYHIHNFNNGIVKGTIALGDDSVLAFGYSGVWLTDRHAKNWTDWNNGLPNGIDNRNIRNITRTKDGMLWMTTQYHLYRHIDNAWQPVSLNGNENRLTDITTTKDSSKVIVMTRSAIYIVGKKSTHSDSKNYGGNDLCITSPRLKTPNGYTPQRSLFKIVWQLHNGELLGLTGRLIVDAMGVVLAILSLTGIALFALPYDIRRKKLRSDKESMKKSARLMKWNLKWHNKIGFSTIGLTLWLSVTGMCLRPPLMIPLALTNTSLGVDRDNAWHDKLRAIRWDEQKKQWLVSTTEGFLLVDENFNNHPTLLSKNATPNVSPMGITVFERPVSSHTSDSTTADDEWLIGSFSGLYRWNVTTGKVINAITGKTDERKYTRPVSDALVCGYTTDFINGKAIVFDYAKGAQYVTPTTTRFSPIAMPQLLSLTKISLWNVALELHVGRCYKPLLGPFSDLFIFISGLLITLVLVSGYIIVWRQKKRRL